jgi:hypothetical protein
LADRSAPIGEGASVRRSALIALLLAVAGGAGGCTAANMPKIPLLSSPPAETAAEAAAAPAAPAASGPTETSLLAPGTPTGVFTQVAHETLVCCVGAGGPLKATHVYRAEAQPPTRGGNAVILIHERDASLRDLRGPRAYRIDFVGEAAGVRVTATALKFEPKIAQAMARDVDTWAKGGSGCQLRALFPPPAPQVAAKATKSASQKKR